MTSQTPPGSEGPLQAIAEITMFIHLLPTERWQRVDVLGLINTLNVVTEVPSLRKNHELSDSQAKVPEDERGGSY